MNACVSALSGGHPVTACCHRSSGAASEAKDRLQPGVSETDSVRPHHGVCSRACYSKRAGPWISTTGNLESARNVDS